MHPDWDGAKLATAAVFYNLHEADIAVGLLESCGVDCFLCDEHMHRVHPLTGKLTAVSGCKCWSRTWKSRKSC